MPEKKNVCVIVLGDIGRSPRMQYHSLSLAQMGHRVDIIGYGETEPLGDVKNAPLLYYHYLVPSPAVPQKFLNYLVKTIWSAINLLFLLFVCKPEILLVQNPPAIPSLAICWIYSSIMNCKFIIDWHNYAHTIMALSVGEENKLVKITKKVESFIGKRAHHNFCVTNAMKTDLHTNWNISATTLYDKPPEIFKSISLEEKYLFLTELGKQYKQLLCEDGSSVFIEKAEDKYRLKTSRPGLLVSSTSWTEDEDFSILFNALQVLSKVMEKIMNYQILHHLLKYNILQVNQSGFRKNYSCATALLDIVEDIIRGMDSGYETHILNGNDKKLPNLICVITGKGPLKEYYCKRIAEENWQHISVITPWLKSEEYPLMLASADLGVSLHTSSSGLDLPMKVVDMFGCGLPVCAYDFKCLDELVHHEKNGYKFQSAEELSSQLQNWFEDFPNNDQQKETEKKFKVELQGFQNLRWKENWNKIASVQFI